MKKNCAIFTIVKDEDYFLPIWLKHYSKYFSKDDIYVLDHDSVDGSTDNLGVKVTKVHRDLAFDHQWLVDTVSSYQSELLQQYEVVIFTEADELLYSIERPLNMLIDSFLINNSQQYLTCTGYEVIHNINKEKPILLGDSIIQNRNEWFKYTPYDKTLISKIPLKWCWGFHDPIGVPREYCPELFMFHLHRVDFEFMLKRHDRRANKWKIKDDGPHAGAYHKIGDRDGVMKYFYNPEGLQSIPIELIPNKHKIALDGI